MDRRKFLAGSAVAGGTVWTAGGLGTPVSAQVAGSPPPPTTTTTSTTTTTEPPKPDGRDVVLPLGPAVWVRSDDVVLDGSAVDQMNDLSGNGNHAIAGLDGVDIIPGYRPTYVAADPKFNDCPSIDFDGIRQALTTVFDINPGVTPALTVASVWCTGTDQGSPIRKLYSHDDGGFDRTVGMDSRSPTEYGTFTGGGVAGYFDPAAGTSYLTVDAWDAAGGMFTGRLNGAPTSSHGVGNGPGKDVTHIGANVAFSEWWLGRIAEMIFIPRLLTAAETADVEAYLLSRYSI